MPHFIVVKTALDAKGVVAEGLLRPIIGGIESTPPSAIS